MYCSTLAQSTPAARKADLSGNSGHAGDKGALAMQLVRQPNLLQDALECRHDQIAEGWAC